MPLTMALKGETMSIKKVTGKDETQRHLAELGLIVGENVTVVAELAGNLIINIKGSRIAIDRAMANRIMI